MIAIPKNPKKFKTLRPGDTGFVMDNGILMAPRAGIEIAKDCPHEYMLMLVKCIRHGWLRPVAHIKDSEYTWELLQK